MADIYIMNDPRINITAGPIELKGFARSLSLTPEDNEIDVATFTDPDGVAYGSTRWTLEVTALQSFGADGLWNQLEPLSKTTVTFEVYPDDGAAVSVTNPSASGSARMPSMPFLTGGSPGEKSEVTLTLPVIGAPVFATV